MRDSWQGGPTEKFMGNVTEHGNAGSPGAGEAQTILDESKGPY